MEIYRVRVSKDYLTFSAAHFLAVDASPCERLHGHNYRVAAEVEGALDRQGLVLDFIVLKRILRKITEELDHRLLVPCESSALAIHVDSDQVRMACRAKEWIVPLSDCALLPIENVTAERLAKYIALRLQEALDREVNLTMRSLRVEIEESPGQSAMYELMIDV